MFKNIGEVKLYYLKTNYDSLAQQGSEAWLQGRKTRFGGSEMGIINTTNKKRKKEITGFLQNKVNGVFTSNLYCWWGTTFEVVAKSYLKYKYNWEIHEFGAIPSSEYPVAFSPDGLFIHSDGDLWLLEIKCPFLRNVVNETPISLDYHLQVQMGMTILPIEKCKFVQIKFRRCKSYHIGKEGKYSRDFHRELKHAKEQKELWYGAIYWETKDAVREDFDMNTKPTKIYTSFEEPKLYDICENYNYGILMYFKCFFVQETLIPKDKRAIEKHNDNIWERYRQLVDLKNKDHFN